MTLDSDFPKDIARVARSLARKEGVSLQVIVQRALLFYIRYHLFRGDIQSAPQSVSQKTTHRR